MPGRTDDDENVPGFLNMNLALEKLARKVHRLEERVVCLEKERLDVKKVELNVAKRVQSMYSYQFDLALYQMEKKLRDELNMRSFENEPPKVVELNDDGKFVEDIDAHLQLLNMQAEAYREMFKSTNWTCLGSLYNRNVKYGCALFVDNRTMYADKGMDGGQVSWVDMDIGLHKFVVGLNDNWPSKAWGSYDQIYGIENIEGSHWAAYAYDFKKKEVRIYESMSSAYNTERREVFGLHVALAPSLFNEGVEKEEDKMDPDIPFVLNIVDVPHHPNGWDCSVYAIKFLQCLAMKTDLHGLDVSHFDDYRRKLADAIKLRWQVYKQQRHDLL
ncbi:hypothetical protein LIER_27677 [Lithospermum erythrorhizon]|uniref:Ubiquitin-like protease family profile domain-containing protein n=1 Tax=Lithospermum erythrorhizon TaxID=34254 RepID=A0AAV3RGB2_LITER